MNPSERLAARGIRPFALVAPLVLALALCASVVACGGDDTTTEPEMAPAAPASPAADAKAAKQARKQAERAAAMAVPEPDETGLEGIFGNGAKVPDDFPKDVPLYPGARPTANMSAAGEGTLVVFEVSDGPEKVYDFYQDQLASGGWEIASSASMGGEWMIHALKDERATHISITGEGSGSQVGVAVAKAE